MTQLKGGMRKPNSVGFRRLQGGRKTGEARLSRSQELVKISLKTSGKRREKDPPPNIGELMRDLPGANRRTEKGGAGHGKRKRKNKGGTSSPD